MAELQIRFDANGLLPVVVQDDESNEVLMMAFMNQEALEMTRKTGEVHFWSRSRAQLWRKGRDERSYPTSALNPYQLQ